MTPEENGKFILQLLYRSLDKQEIEDPIEVSLESTLEWAQRLGETIEVSL